MADPDYTKIRTGEKLCTTEGKEKMTSTPLADKANLTNWNLAA